MRGKGTTIGTGVTKKRTAQSDYLLGLGTRVLRPYTELPLARAAMITGSVAEGVSDHYSDLDMTVYYEGELPSEEALAEIRTRNGAPERAWLICDDPAHAWVRDTWATQTVDPRLPLGGTR